jgi:hypothetical protein
MAALAASESANANPTGTTRLPTNPRFFDDPQRFATNGQGTGSAMGRATDALTKRTLCELNLSRIRE